MTSLPKTAEQWNLADEYTANSKRYAADSSVHSSASPCTTIRDNISFSTFTHSIAVSSCFAIASVKSHFAAAPLNFDVGRHHFRAAIHSRNNFVRLIASSITSDIDPA